MCMAAGVILEVFSEEIAMLLLDKTLQGNVPCAKLLFAVAEGQLDCEDKATLEGIFSLAEKLALETEWKSEVIEATVETDFEKRPTSG